MGSTSWPGGARFAVSLTSDVAAEAGWLGEGAGYACRLTTLHVRSDRVAATAQEGRHLTLTMHPEVFGRASRFAAFARLLEELVGAGDAWIAPLRDVALRCVRRWKQRCPQLHPFARRSPSPDPWSPR